MFTILAYLGPGLILVPPDIEADILETCRHMEWNNQTSKQLFPQATHLVKGVPNMFLRLIHKLI